MRRNPFNVNANPPGAGSHMSDRSSFDARALWGTDPKDEADEAPAWAEGMHLVPAETTDDLIQAMYPGAKPYRPRGGENDGT
ncbi:MAG: hypothetical protein JW895_00835 [Thermoleophilaceae bacterium]|nr:hypothetical protein [Thermoleophilaceae bacterium]